MTEISYGFLVGIAAYVCFLFIAFAFHQISKSPLPDQHLRRLHFRYLLLSSLAFWLFLFWVRNDPAKTKSLFAFFSTFLVLYYPWTTDLVGGITRSVSGHYLISLLNSQSFSFNNAHNEMVKVLEDRAAWLSKIGLVRLGAGGEVSITRLGKFLRFVRKEVLAAWKLG